MGQPGFCSHPERAIGRFVDRRDAIINQAIEGRESGDLNTIIAHASSLQFPKAQPNRSQRRSAPHRAVRRNHHRIGCRDIATGDG